MEEQPVKVKHHYVPACYLRYFTEENAKDGQLNVIDMQTGNEWLSTPQGVACENHYNSVEGALRPDAFEDIFEMVENGAAPHWHEMVHNREFPSDPEAENWILNFLALLEVRTKPTRKFIKQLYTESAKRMMSMACSTSARFEAQVNKAKKGGVAFPDLPPGMTLEDVRKRYTDGSMELDFKIHNNYYVQQTFEHANVVLQLFGQRAWAVCDLSNSSIDLVTSDDPISIVWTVAMPPVFSPGLGLRNTLLFIPLTSKLVLLGSFENETLKAPGSTRIAHDLFILYLNSITISQAFRFVYSKNNQIFFQTAITAWNDKEALKTFIAKKINERSQTTAR